MFDQFIFILLIANLGTGPGLARVAGINLQVFKRFRNTNKHFFDGQQTVDFVHLVTFLVKLDDRLGWLASELWKNCGKGLSKMKN